jgi:halimadienyl-diphosphate synthase
MKLFEDVRTLLQEVGPGRMAGTAYDTAWVARLAELGEPIGKQALYWLRENQLTDGSWGAPDFCYYHDRLISTLAAATALARQGDTRDRIRLQRAQVGLVTAIKGLQVDPVGETIGFEMIMPTLLAEARSLGILRPGVTGTLRMAASHALASKNPPAKPLSYAQRDEDYLQWLAQRRQAKIQSLPVGKINRYVTVAFSAEMVGMDGVGLLDLDHLQDSNGSVAQSPSATAYFAVHVRPQDEAALSYLRQVAARSNGNGVPQVSPFDVFERAWVLWNLAVAGPLDEEIRAMCMPHAERAYAAWQPGLGSGFTADYAPRGGDETSLTFEALTRFGQPVDLEAVLHYEVEDHFRCFDLESNPSISANVHVLGALRYAGLDKNHPTVQKVLKFLKQNQLFDLFWLDKWHVSPYYPTTHALITAAGYADELAANAVGWILETQKADGSWGYYAPTAEETAYCLQALVTWKRHGWYIPEDVLMRGRDWLGEHQHPPYPSLWLGKCLYCPELVVRSAVLSALMLCEQE